MFKKILIIAMLIVLMIPSTSFAIKLLNDATATGTGNPIKVEHLAFTILDCDITMTGSPSAVTVRIEKNNGGTLYDPTGMATHACTSMQLTAGICSFAIKTRTAVNLRANLTVLTGGTSPAIDVDCEARR